jgi:hypothetical protein
MDTFTHIAVIADDEAEYGCDECCAFPLQHERWRCSICPEFDACSACYAKGEHTHRASNTRAAAVVYLHDKAWTEDTMEEEGAYDSERDDAILQRSDLLTVLAYESQVGGFSSQEMIAALVRMQRHKTREGDAIAEFIRVMISRRDAFVETLRIEKSMAESAMIQKEHALPMSRRDSFCGELFIVQKAESEVSTRATLQQLLTHVAHACALLCCAVSADHVRR